MEAEWTFRGVSGRPVRVGNAATSGSPSARGLTRGLTREAFGKGDAVALDKAGVPS